MSTVFIPSDHRAIMELMMAGGLGGSAAFIAGYRVEPGDIAELREIRIGGDHGQAVLAGQRR